MADVREVDRGARRDQRGAARPAQRDLRRQTGEVLGRAQHRRRLAAQPDALAVGPTAGRSPFGFLRRRRRESGWESVNM